MKTGIYKIQSKIKPQRVYIGSAIDIKRSEESNEKNRLSHLGKTSGAKGKHWKMSPEAISKRLSRKNIKIIYVIKE